MQRGARSRERARMPFKGEVVRKIFGPGEAASPQLLPLGLPEPAQLVQQVPLAAESLGGGRHLHRRAPVT